MLRQSEQINIQETIYLTLEGKEKIQEKLDFLSTVKRKEIIQLLQDMGIKSDVSEDEEFALLKVEQGFVEGKIKQLDDLLYRSEIIICSLKNEIGIGSTVHLLNSNGNYESYRIVGRVEANPEKGLISNESPLGQVLIGRKPGEFVTVNAPCGAIRYQISNVE